MTGRSISSIEKTAAVLLLASALIPIIGVRLLAIFHVLTIPGGLLLGAAVVGVGLLLQA